MKEKLARKKKNTFSRVDDETSTIAADSIDIALFMPATRTSRLQERRIIIRESSPQDHNRKHTEAKGSNDKEDPDYRRKGERKKKSDKVSEESTRDSTPSFLRKAIRETTDHRFR